MCSNTRPLIQIWSQKKDKTTNLTSDAIFKYLQYSVLCRMYKYLSVYQNFMPLLMTGPPLVLFQSLSGCRLSPCRLSVTAGHWGSAGRPPEATGRTTASCWGTARWFCRTRPSVNWADSTLSPSSASDWCRDDCTGQRSRFTAALWVTRRSATDGWVS